MEVTPQHTQKSNFALLDLDPAGRERARQNPRTAPWARGTRKSRVTTNRKTKNSPHRLERKGSQEGREAKGRKPKARSRSWGCGGHHSNHGATNPKAEAPRRNTLRKEEGTTQQAYKSYAPACQGATNPKEEAPRAGPQQQHKEGSRQQANKNKPSDPLPLCHNSSRSPS